MPRVAGVACRAWRAARGGIAAAVNGGGWRRAGPNPAEGSRRRRHGADAATRGLCVYVRERAFVCVSEPIFIVLEAKGFPLSTSISTYFNKLELRKKLQCLHGVKMGSDATKLWVFGI